MLNPPASASWVLEFQAYTNASDLEHFFYFNNNTW